MRVPRVPWTQEDLAELDRLFELGEVTSPTALAVRFGRTPDAMVQKVKERYGARRPRACPCGAVIEIAAEGGRPNRLCPACLAEARIRRCIQCSTPVGAGRKVCDSCRHANRVASQHRWYLSTKDDPDWQVRRAAADARRRARKKAAR